jgi:SAM-dependent methyltransferase
LYDNGFADVYDQIYAAAGKDYAGEAAALADLIGRRNPGAASVLDVGCGTGAHLRHLRGLFAHVEGVEISASMRSVAAAGLPGTAIHAGDMRTFRLRRRFDAVVCLFCAIGYMRDTADLEAAVARMAAHLAPGGILVVEPWVGPDQYRDGTIGHVVAEQGGRTVVRMCHFRRGGRLSLMDMHYLVGDSGGVRHWMETHKLRLFTVDEYRRAFTRAGLAAVELVAGLPPACHRFVAVKPGGPSSPSCDVAGSPGRAVDPAVDRAVDQPSVSGTRAAGGAVRSTPAR